MGKVIQLRPKSLVEFENSALRKLIEVAELASRVPDMLAGLAGTPAHLGGHETAKRFIHLLSILDEAIYALEAFAPEATQTMGSGERAIFELQCELTRLRITAFASVRCSILYINDFTMDGLDAAISELSRTVLGAA